MKATRTRPGAILDIRAQACTIHFCRSIPSHCCVYARKFVDRSRISLQGPHRGVYESESSEDADRCHNLALAFRRLGDQFRKCMEGCKTFCCGRRDLGAVPVGRIILSSRFTWAKASQSAKRCRKKKKVVPTITFLPVGILLDRTFDREFPDENVLFPCKININCSDKLPQMNFQHPFTFTVNSDKFS